MRKVNKYYFMHALAFFNFYAISTIINITMAYLLLVVRILNPYYYGIIRMHACILAACNTTRVADFIV